MSYPYKDALDAVHTNEEENGETGGTTRPVVGLPDDVKANLALLSSGVAILSLPAANSAGPFAAQGSQGTSATQLSSQALKHGIRIKNTHITNTLYIGITGVTTSTGFPLSAGQETFIPLANLNQVYLIASGASTTYATLAS